MPTETPCKDAVHYTVIYRHNYGLNDFKWVERLQTGWMTSNGLNDFNCVERLQMGWMISKGWTTYNGLNDFKQVERLQMGWTTSNGLNDFKWVEQLQTVWTTSNGFMAPWGWSSNNRIFKQFPTCCFCLMSFHEFTHQNEGYNTSLNAGASQ